MTGTPDPDAFAAWRAAIAANLLTLAGAAVGFIMFPSPMSMQSPLTRIRVIQIALSVSWLTMLAVRRRRPSLDWSLTAFGLSVVPQLVLVWVVGAEHEALGRGWEPFLRQKLILLLFGVLGVRQYWVSLIMIGAVTVGTALEYWIGGMRLSLFITPDEPWVTFGFAVGAGLLAISRGRQIAYERQVTEKRRDDLAARRLAHVALAVRDLANTPLQTLVLHLWMLERRHPDLELAAIRRAVERLEQLGQILSEYEAPPGRARSRAEESFDAVDVLRPDPP